MKEILEKEKTSTTGELSLKTAKALLAGQTGPGIKESSKESVGLTTLEH